MNQRDRDRMMKTLANLECVGRTTNVLLLIILVCSIIIAVKSL